MQPIDTAICTALLRGVTDQLQSSMRPPAAGADTASLIRTVLQASAWAKETLQRALRAQFPFGTTGATISPYVVSPRSGT